MPNRPDPRACFLTLFVLAALTACRSPEAEAPFSPARAEASPTAATPVPVTNSVPSEVISSVATAVLSLPGFFSDNMVLQQGVSVPVWGWADEGETVSVSFRGQKVTARTTGNKWMARLEPLKAGGPDTLVISGKKSIEFTNVLVGEVWVCSGQSNMEWPLNKSYEADPDLAAATNFHLRLFTVPKLKALEPTNNVNARWQVSSPESAKNFSAVAYYFGRHLQNAHNVPVGLIHTSWGGSPAEVWMSRDTLESNLRYKAEIIDAYPNQLKNYEESLRKLEEENEQLKKDGKPPRNRPWTPWRPTELYNGMIAPLLPYAIKGAIWYQGESNAGRAEQYRALYADMIRNWRKDWGQGDFPFLAVQLAPFMKIKEQPGDSTWAELREAQLLATQTMPKVGMAVITDVGEEDDIHPTKKAPVGDRLALAARGIAYGEKIVYSGPIYKRMRVRGDKAILSFDNVGSGLEARGGALKGFAICGEDRKFVWAVAEIQEDTVVVSSPNIEKPVAVRYGWADFPVVNLWNRDGLPATPFRTDNFPLITASKK